MGRGGRNWQTKAGGIGRKSRFRRGHLRGSGVWGVSEWERRKGQGVGRRGKGTPDTLTLDTTGPVWEGTRGPGEGGGAVAVPRAPARGPAPNLRTRGIVPARGPPSVGKRTHAPENTAGTCPGRAPRCRKKKKGERRPGTRSKTRLYARPRWRRKY